MFTRTVRISFLWAAVLGALCATEAASARANAIRPGDKLKVTIGPAPVTLGVKTLTTVRAGAELTAQEVKGDLVKVTVDINGKKTQGWIHRVFLKPVATKPPEDAAPEKPVAEDDVVIIMAVNRGTMGMPLEIQSMGGRTLMRRTVPANGSTRLVLKKGPYGIIWGRFSGDHAKTKGTAAAHGVAILFRAENWTFTQAQQGGFTFWRRRVEVVENNKKKQEN